MTNMDTERTNMTMVVFTLTDTFTYTLLFTKCYITMIINETKFFN